MKVYHGSTTIVEKPLVSAGRKHLDFGQGFYLTDLKEQAAEWASRPMNDGMTQYLNIYELDMDGLRASGCRYRRFEAYDFQWLDFVVANRRGENLWTGYDVVEGGIANDRVFNTIELYMDELISRDEALQRLKYEKPNNQICILSQEMADRYLTFIEAQIINHEHDR